MHEARLAVGSPIARIHAPRLEIAAHRAARDFAVGPALAVAGHPDFDVVSLLCCKTHVAGAQRHHAIMQIELPQNFLGAGQHALVLVLAGFRRRDRDQLDLCKLMLPDHAAGVAPRGAGFGAEARRQRRQPHRQLLLVDDGLAH